MKNSFFKKRKKEKSIIFDYRLAFSQDGEDLCLYSYILEEKPNYKGFYVDIGALDPFRFSNTCLFYQNGWHGINIDATPGSMKKFDQFRQRDINIETVISDKSGEEVSYFMFNEPALNCFDKKRLNDISSHPQYKLIKEKKLKTKTINEILDKYLPAGQKIDFITIDIEGVDVEVIRSLNYEKYAPEYFIVEELDYQQTDFTTYANSPIYQILSQKGYIVVAKTKRSVIYKKQGKKLSIITICYNEKQIERTCKSIVNQTWQDFEWIVVDGGSTDGTLDILNKYKDRIDILISEPDKGRYNAMNKGIKLAQGKYLNFMNGGDAFYNSTVLEKLFKDREQTADVLYGKCCAKENKKQSVFTYPENLDVSYWFKYTLNHQASFIKKELFEKYGPYNEKYKIAADKEKFVLFYQKGCSFQYLPEIIALYDLTGISATNQKLSLTETSHIEKKYLLHHVQYNCTLFGLFHFKKKSD